MTARFVIPGRLPGLNEYTRVCRGRAGNRLGNAMKREAERTIGFAAMQGLKRWRCKGKVKIVIRWVEPDARRDLDNIAFARKFILDALVHGGYLPDDNRRYVVGLVDDFPPPDKHNPRVEVELVEVEE